MATWQKNIVFIGMLWALSCPSLSPVFGEGQPHYIFNPHSPKSSPFLSLPGYKYEKISQDDIRLGQRPEPDPRTGIVKEWELPTTSNFKTIAGQVTQGMPRIYQHSQKHNVVQVGDSINLKINIANLFRKFRIWVAER